MFGVCSYYNITIQVQKTNSGVGNTSPAAKKFNACLRSGAKEATPKPGAKKPFAKEMHEAEHSRMT
jgi:hypothetical protein